MHRFTLLIIFLALSVAQAEQLTGHLKNNLDLNNFVMVLEEDKSLEEVPLLNPAAFSNALNTLADKTPFVIANGSWSLVHANTFEISEIPTIVSGNKTVSGILEKDNQGNYWISNTPVVFGRTKMLHGAQFDELSKNYFVGKEVTVRGTTENDRLVINSILRHGIFTASSQSYFEDKHSKKEFSKNPLKAALRMVAGRSKSPSPSWLRTTLIAEPNATVAPGEQVLIITASGREVDVAGAVNGHFAIGRGVVQNDLEVTGELFNVYVTTEKEIIPGNLNMVDYYGHLVSGQNNYRPTYTLLIYGISDQNIQKLRDQLDRFHPIFRSTDQKITVNINCTTLSVQALGDIGLYGKHREKGRNGTEQFPNLSSQNELPPTIKGSMKSIAYFFNHKKAEFMPGPAFNSLLSNLQKVNIENQLGIKRVDFIFGGQTPSDRPVGGPPPRGLPSMLYQQFKVLLKQKLHINH